MPRSTKPATAKRLSDAAYDAILSAIADARSKDRVDLLIDAFRAADESEQTQVLASIAPASARRSPRKPGKKGTTKGTLLAENITVKGHCMKCKRQRPIVKARLVKMNHNGGAAVKGECGTCGRGVFRMGGVPEPAAKKVKATLSAAKKSAAVKVVKGDLRSDKGNVRNFKSMSDVKLAQLVKASRGTKDTEARRALLAVVRERKAA